MRLPKIATVAAAAAAAICASGLVSAQSPQGPCNTPEHRAFDFWLGEWNVYGPQGKLTGTNSIKSEYGGCVLHERYETGRGYSGESFNIYDAPRKVWHQTWVDSSGLLLVLEGGLVDGKMVLTGRTIGADGQETGQRITWTPYPDGSVRQLWEATGPDGEWTVAFDGTYTPK